MKLLRRSALVVLLGCSPLMVWSQAATPEGALEEILTTNKLEVFSSHLPMKLLEGLGSMDDEQRKEILARFHLRVQSEQSGKTWQRSGDGRSWELLIEHHQAAVINLVHTFISGSDAVLQLEATQYPDAARNHKSTYLVFMRLESGDWRVVSWHESYVIKDLESEDFLKQATPAERNAAVAASMLRTLNTALVTYSTTYPERGYPPSFKELSGSGDDEQSEQHARMVGPAFLADRVIMEGYEFHYTSSGDWYKVTATPVQYGKNGKKSFFTDETAVLRYTDENRPANEHDKGLDNDD